MLFENSYAEYLRMTMNSLSTILYNTSQSDSPYNSKDAILDSIKKMIEDYNGAVLPSYQVSYQDFRKK